MTATVEIGQGSADRRTEAPASEQSTSGLPACQKHALHLVKDFVHPVHALHLGIGVPEGQEPGHQLENLRREGAPKNLRLSIRTGTSREGDRPTKKKKDASRGETQKKTSVGTWHNSSLKSLLQSMLEQLHAHAPHEELPVSYFV